jgi:sigma-B regulation protein RsbU (phosphoserine phosphatase)
VADLAELLVGAMIFTIGAIALGFASLQRPRTDRTAVWFGVFVVLYGSRMVLRVPAVQDAVPLSPGGWAAIDSTITHVIGLPGALFIKSLLAAERDRLIRLAVYVFAARAVAGVAADVIRQAPHSVNELNAIAVLFGVIAAARVLIVRTRGGHIPSEARPALFGLGMFLGAATINTLAADRFGRHDLLEGTGMLALVLGLAYMVAARTLAAERRMTAISRDLEVASRIQRSILPAGVPPQRGLDLAARYLPIAEVAGDLYDWVALDEQRLAVLVADVSGHGVSAALVASMVKIAFASATEHLVDPAAILASMNRTLDGKFERAYVTAICTVIDGATGTLLHASAGHPPGLVRRRGRGQIDRLDAGGIALAFAPDAEYSAGRTVLAPGDTVFLFSDGLTDAQNARGDFFGDSRLAAAVATIDRVAADSAATDLLDELRAWTGRTPLHDDVTVVIIARREVARERVASV